jgi:hypothetical protein
MKREMARQAHDAAVALGAQCDDSCVFNNGGGAIDQVMMAAIIRAKALAFLTTSG